MSKKIIEIEFDRDNNGKYHAMELDENVKEIREHQPQGEGDKWYYDVIFSDTSELRLFNVTKVLFDKELNKPIGGSKVDET